MAREDAIRTEGRIGRVLKSVLFRVVLSNGHELLGYAPQTQRMRHQRWKTGDWVLVEVSPFDLSKGMIVDKIIRKD